MLLLTVLGNLMLGTPVPCSPLALSTLIWLSPGMFSLPLIPISPSFTAVFHPSFPTPLPHLCTSLPCSHWIWSHAPHIQPWTLPHSWSVLPGPFWCVAAINPIGTAHKDPSHLSFPAFYSHQQRACVCVCVCLCWSILCVCVGKNTALGLANQTQPLIYGLQFLENKTKTKTQPNKKPAKTPKTHRFLE